MRMDMGGGVVAPGWAAPVTASLDLSRCSEPVPLLQPAPRLRRSSKPARNATGADSGKSMLEISVSVSCEYLHGVS